MFLAPNVSEVTNSLEQAKESNCEQPIQREEITDIQFAFDILGSPHHNRTSSPHVHPEMLRLQFGGSMNIFGK